MFANHTYPADKFLPKGVSHPVFWENHFIEGRWVHVLGKPRSAESRKLTKKIHKKRSRVYND